MAKSGIPITILFVAVNSDSQHPLDLDEELREIKTKLRASQQRDLFHIEVCSAARADDLLQALNDVAPHIVHFSGHGNKQQELIMLDYNRQPHPVSKEALIALFRTLKNNIRIVLLNACYSEPQAQAITSIIDCAIGMNRAIGDNAAIAFAASFYRALASQCSVENAYQQGRTSLLLQNIPEENTPVLITRSGVDASSIYLTSHASVLAPPTRSLGEDIVVPSYRPSMEVGSVQTQVSPKVEHKSGLREEVLHDGKNVPSSQPVTFQMKFEMILCGDIAEVTKASEILMIERLQKLLQGPGIPSQISLEGIESGSIRLQLRGSKEVYERLTELFEANILTDVLGYKIEAIQAISSARQTVPVAQPVQTSRTSGSLRTVIGLFDEFSQAEAAVRNLENAGIPQNDISIVASNANNEYTTWRENYGRNYATSPVADGANIGAAAGGIGGILLGLGLLAIPGLGPLAAAGPLVAGLTGAGVGAVTGASTGGLISALTNVGVPEEHATYFSEGIRRGGTLVTISAADNIVDQAINILNQHGAVDINQRVDYYRQTGNTGYNINNVNAQGEAVLPVIEENLSVGKRVVQSGGVRVYSHVIETPAEASVNLREEHVTVDRRPVDRPADANTINAIREGVVEVTETSEVPVVSKEARIVEEVVVGKEVTQRTETVRDTVRRTDVNVEEIAGQSTTTGTTLGSTVGHTARDLADNAAGEVKRTEGSIPGIQTGGRAIDGSNTPDTRGITEKVADTVTGNRVDDKTGRPA